MIGELWRESSGVSSFFFRVLFSLLGINLATIVALLYIAYTFSTEALSRHAETSIVQQVDILSVQFNEQYKNALNRVARSLTDASLLDDYLLVSEAERLVLARRLERLFMQMQNDYQDFCTISFVDSNGYIVVEVEENQRQSPRMLAGQKKNQTEWFYAGELFDLLRDTPLLLATGDNKWSMPSRTLRASRLFIGDDDVPKLVAGLGKLDIDTGLFGGAILIQLRLDRWLDELRSILFFGANPVWVVDMEGNTILAPEDAKATYDPRPHLPVETDNGTHLLKAEGGLIVYRDLEIEEGAALLRIAVSLPNELLLSGISKAVDFFTVVIDAYLLVIVISVIMLAIFSFFIARFLAKPVLKLAALQKQLEQQQVSLSESEHRLQEAQSLAGLGNWELNPDTDEAFWSDEQYRLLGYKPGEVKACFSRFMEAIHPDDRPAMSSELRRLGQSGEKDTVSFEHRILLPGGGERMVAENGHAVFDQAGRLLRIFGTTLDITARHHLEQLRNRREKGLETLDRRMRRLSTLLHQPQRFYVAVCDGIKELVSADLSALPLIDNSGSTYTYVAAAGTKSGHLVGQTLPLDSGLCGWTVSHGERILVANLKQDERVNQSLLEQLDVSSGLLTPITREGRIIGGLAAYRKGTPFDEIDDEMIGLLGQRVSAYLDNMELMTTLEHRVRERTLELEAINRELASFSYSVSHDLRAPLRAIDGFSQALLEDYGNTLDATGHDYLFRVRRACQRMGSLIDDMLGLSRLTRREMRWERVDLSQLAKTSVEQLRIHAPRESVTLRIRDGVEANADAKLMQIVFDNLMGNAWKYTSREAISVIEFDYLDSPDGRTYFVRDNGVGFDMQYADKLFGAFQRLHKESEFEGSGIGLATVARIIHRHGGRIWAEGQVDKGATFYFTLT